MTNGIPNEHLSAERLQAFLEGEVSDPERARAEEHLTVCARCSSELDSWRALLEDLDELPAHLPPQGFADRVMAGLVSPDTVPIAARSSARAFGSAEHLDETVLQDYLDGAIGARAAAGIESHLAACSACSEEAESWATVIARVEGLERYAPSEGFARRVMTGVELARPHTIAAGLRARLVALLPARASAHPDAGRLQDFVEGVLPAWHAGGVRAHLDACGSCEAEVGAWRAVMARLETLERHAPSEAFAERVMRGVGIPVPAPAVARAPTWSRALAPVRALLPRTRQAWAAISGVAVTPAVVSGLVLYAVFSHPTVTPASLASFLWWQIADLGAAGWTALSAATLQSAELFGIYSLLGTLASAPLAVAGGVLAYSLVSAVALRVLYKNIIANRPMDRRYASVSAS